MPLTADSIVQTNTGSAAAGATSVVVTLPTGTTAGNSLIAIFWGADFAPGIATGWATPLDLSTPTGGAPRASVAHKSDVSAGETSWTFTLVSSPETWFVAEVAGLDPDVPLDVWAGAGTYGAPTVPTSTFTQSTGTTAAGSAMDTLVFGVWTSTLAAGAPAGSWTPPAGLSVVASVVSTDATANTHEMTVASGLSGGAAAGPWSYAATYTQPASGGGDNTYGFVFTLRAVDSPLAYPVTWCSGFEQGSHFGIGSAPTIGKALFTTATGTPGTDIVVQASSARPGGSGYGCRIVQSAAAKSLYVSGDTVLVSRPVTADFGFGVRVVSSTGLVVLASLDATNLSLMPSAQLVYDTATSKLGVRLGTSGTPGTPVYQSGTTAANTWVWVDLRTRLYRPGGTTYAKVDWALDGVIQSSPADATSTLTSNFWNLRIGSTTTQTVTFDVDDLVFSPHVPAFPLGPHTIRALTVDPAGTPTVNGTVGNFALVTNNATGAALTTGTLTSARNNIDELPPTISTASDGVVQTAVAATDYLQFPMADLTLSSSEILAAVKVLACLISTTGAGAGSLSIKGWDGVTEHGTITSTGAAMTPGNSTTQSATVPPYSTGMWPNTWTPTKLSAAALRVGYSDDATPDMGVHAIYLEVATRPAVTARQLSIEDDTFTVDVTLSPYSSASVSYDVASGDATRGATFSYSLAGTPQTPVYVAASTTTTVTVDVDAFGDVSDVTLEPDP